MNPIAVVNTSTDDELSIEMIIGTTCNFKCSYCFPECNDGKYRWPVGSQVDAIHKNLSYLFDVYKAYGKTKFAILITGGEPTLWPELGSFARYFKEKYDARISISTNGSRTMRWWKQHAHNFSSIGVSVHNEESDIEQIIELLDWVYLNTDTAVHAAVLMDNKNWDKCVSMVERLQQHNVPWLVRAREVIDGNDIVEYTSSQLKYLENKTKKSPPLEYRKKMEQENKINDRIGKAFTIYNDSKEDFSSVKWYANNWHLVKGWKCSLGVDRFVVNPDGMISGSCKADNVFNLESPLNIYDNALPDKFSLKDINPLICKMPACMCSTELALSKEMV